MTDLFDLSDENAPAAKAAKALQMPIGAASPLWLVFAGAASAGVAYWWLTRWRRPTNLEALLAAREALDAEPVVEPALEEALSEPASIEAEAVEVEPVEVVAREPEATETVTELAAEGPAMEAPVAEATVDQAPVVAADAAPKPARKPRATPAASTAPRVRKPKA